MKKTWETKNGEEIEISKMTDQHLLNTIKMLERNAEVGGVRVLSYGYEGDNDFMTGDCEDVYGEDYLKCVEEYPWLKEEAEKRGLLNNNTLQ